VLASLIVVALAACTEERPEATSVEWDAPRPEVVSAWRDESPFAYNTYSDVDRRGRLVVFASSVRDGPAGVYLRNMRTNKILRIDVWHTGDQPRPGSAADEANYRQDTGVPVISADGRFVAFSSSSPHLVPRDENGASDLFLYDRRSRRLRLVSTNDRGVQGNRGSLYPSISADGRFVAFSSRATNLVSDPRTHSVEVYVKDLRSGRIRLVSRGGDERLSGTAWNASISDDGTRVAFTCDAGDLVDGDGNRVRDAFVADLATGDITLVSVTSDGKSLDPFEYEESASSYGDGVGEVAISGDGRTVTFTTHSNGLVPEDKNNNVDAYVHDLDERTTERVSVTSDGKDAYRAEDRECGTNGQCFTFIASHSTSISDNGRYVAFVSGAPLLDPHELDESDPDESDPQDEDVFVHDRSTGRTVLVNRSFRGRPVRNYNLYPGSISGDGRWVSFSTDGRLLRDKHGRGENGDVYLQRLPLPFRAARS
jgi:Tol biopolymer transport system component